MMNKNKIIITLLKSLTVKKLIRIDNLTRKNYYMLSSLSNNKLGQSNKIIKINYSELIHQDLLIKWLSQQNDILSYQTEKELKAEGHLIKDVWGNTKSKQGYPDLLVHYENKVMIIEFDGLRHYCKNGYDVLFLVPNESMKKFVDEQIKIYNWKLATFKTKIFYF